MFTIRMLLGLWLFILYVAAPLLAHDITNITVTTTSTLVVSVFDFAPTTHLTLTRPISTIAQSNSSIQALAATPTITTDVYISNRRYHTSETTGPGILTSTITAVATNTTTNEKEDKGGDGHESHSHTTPPPQSKVAKLAWVDPSTAALLCFDFLAATFFVWCWVMGWFSWLRGEQGRDCGIEQGRGQVYRTGEAGDSGMRMLVNQNVEREMRRLGMI